MSVQDSDLPDQATDVQPDEGQGDPTAASAVQPDEGQGQQGNSLYEEALSSVPEELRPHVESHFKEWDKRVQAKLTEAAEVQKHWDRYSAVVDGIEPDSIASLLEWAGQLDPDQPDTAREALLSLAGSLGVDFGDAAPAEEAGDPDPVAELRERLEAFETRDREQREAEEMSQLEAQERERITSEWTAVMADHKTAADSEMSEDDQAVLKELATRFALDHDEPIRAAYDLIQKVSGTAQKRLVAGAPTQPRPAERAGRASTGVTAPETFEEAQRQMTERRRVSALA